MILHFRSNARFILVERNFFLFVLSLTMGVMSLDIWHSNSSIWYCFCGHHYLFFVYLFLSQIIPGCHSLLIGPKGAGRKTLVRLAAEAMDAQIYELGYNSQLENKRLKPSLREVCMTSGLEKRRVVLLIDSCYIKGTEQWYSLLELMNGGEYFGRIKPISA